MFCKIKKCFSYVDGFDLKGASWSWDWFGYANSLSLFFQAAVLQMFYRSSGAAIVQISLTMVYYKMFFFRKAWMCMNLGHVLFSAVLCFLTNWVCMNCKHALLSASHNYPNGLNLYYSPDLRLWPGFLGQRCGRWFRTCLESSQRHELTVTSYRLIVGLTDLLAKCL